MPLFTKTTVGPTGTTQETYDVDPMGLLGVGGVLATVYGAFRWVRKKIRE